MAKKRTAKFDAISKVRHIAETAKPTMRVVQVIPTSEQIQAEPDAIAPDIEDARRKYGLKPATTEKPSKPLHMVVMEPKRPTDASVTPRRLTLVVDEDKVVGEQ